MRQDAVDISRYLPSFLGKSEQLQATNDADSKEHETIRVDLQDVLDQFFVESATWGLERWEELVGLETDTTRSTFQRRAAILAKLLKPESVTELFLTRLINHYVADRAASIVSIPAEYRIEILYHGGQVMDYEGLIHAIRTYIPAHIGWKLVTYTVGMLYLHGAGVVQDARRTKVGMTVNYVESADDMAVRYAGRVIHSYKYTKVEGGA